MTEMVPVNGDFLAAIRRSLARLRRARAEGEPSMSKQLGQIGVLGWIIVTPALIGLFGGRWLDRHLATGIFYTAALLVAGVALGFWSAWRWMHTP
jgi:ATP synthase protein I